MQETSDTTGVDYDTILYDRIPWKPANLFLCSEGMQHRSTTLAYLTGCKGANFPPC